MTRKIITLMCAVFLVSCLDVAPTEVLYTETPIENPTIQPSETSTPTLSPVPSLPATNTPLPTATFDSRCEFGTPVHGWHFQAYSARNVRSGPSITYPYLNTLYPTKEVDVLCSFTSVPTDWWLKIPGGWVAYALDLGSGTGSYFGELWSD